jgi:hypothetical protein
MRVGSHATNTHPRTLCNTLSKSPTRNSRKMTTSSRKSVTAFLDIFGQILYQNLLNLFHSEMPNYTNVFI